MSKAITTVALLVSAFTLASCGGVPGKSEVQGALDRYAQENPIMFGSDKPVVKDAKCTKVGNDTYDCQTSLTISSEPNDAHTVTIKLTKLNGKWQAQITNLLG